MKLKGTFVFLGIKAFTSQKQPGKEFKSACFLQGTDTLEVFLNDDSEKLVHSVLPMEIVDCELEIRFGQKTFTSLFSVHKQTLDLKQNEKPDEKSDEKLDDKPEEKPFQGKTAKSA